MNKLCFKFIPTCLYLIFFISQLFSQSGWQQQVSNTSQALTCIDFINDNTGWATGDSGVILQTTNGGVNWTKRITLAGNTNYSVRFINSYTGWIGGYVTNRATGYLSKTTNNGNSWYTISTSEPLQIFTFRGDTIWSATYSGSVIRSTNQGASWTFFNVQSNLELYTVFFTNQQTGWTGGGVYQGLGYLYQTTDAGASWNLQFIPSGNHVRSIYFINDITGFFSTYQGNVYKTTTGGALWDEISTGMAQTLFNIRIIDSNIGFCTGSENRMYKTVDGGYNWSLQILPGSVPSNELYFWTCFRNAYTGWVTGLNGVILKTTNGGDPIGIQQINNSVPKEYSLSQNYPNPFNPVTNVHFSIPKDGNVSFKIYNTLGQLVATYFDGFIKAGNYNADIDGTNMASGVYFYTLIGDGFIQTKKMILTK